MHKNLVKHGNSLALVIDKPILQLLNIDSNTKLEIAIENGMLIIRTPKAVTKKKALSKEKRAQLVEKLAEEILDTYHDAFKKLAQ